MGAVLTRIDDPRDLLDKATRDEVFDFAQENGVTDITEDMPAILMRKILRAKGLTKINIPNRPLGANPGVEVDGIETPGEKVPEIDADDDLMRQFLAERQPAKPEQTDPMKMTMGELRAEGKRRGIKMSRTDNMKTLRIKVSGQIAH